MVTFSNNFIIYFVNTHFNLAISIVILAIFLQVIFDFMEIWISKAENQRLIIKRDNRLFASIKEHLYIFNRSRYGNSRAYIYLQKRL